MKPHYLLLALGAILLWSSMATLSVGLAHLPPLLMVGIALSLGGLPGLLRLRDWRIPLSTFAVGVLGIFGYHFLLFTGFHHAPIVEANLLNYLWPLLIVLLTPLVLRGTRLAPRHLLGAFAGLLGAGLIATGGTLHPDLASLPGYLLAAAAALTWAFYSLLTKRLPAFGSGAVGAFCLTAGVLSLGVYLLQKGPTGFLLIRASDWPLLLVIGLGPLGSAFYLWDAALKRGDSRVIGSLSYITPLMSTLLLVLVGGKSFSLLSAMAMVLIVAGAVIGSLGAFRGPAEARPQGRRGIQAVLFDFDGTLTRPEAIDFGALRRLLGCPTGVPILEYIEGLQTADERAEAMGRLERFELDAARASVPNEGAEAILLLLKQRGIPSGIITRNCLASVLEALKNFERLSIEDFSVVVTRESPYPPKPHPGGVIGAAQELGVAPSRMVVVGDYVFDIAAGKAAGATSVLLAPRGPGPAPAFDGPREYATPDHTIARLEELRPILGL